MALAGGVACVGLLAPAPAEPQEAAGVDAIPVTAETVLAAAFANRYDVDFVSDIELVMRSDSGSERRRRVQAVAKLIDGRLHSVGRLTTPEYLRGMTILTIENVDRSHDAFVFLPALKKVRRVSTAQKGDAFFGSDVTYEDLERRRVDEFELGPLEAGTVEGEAVYLVDAKRVDSANYARVVFAVAQSDGSILSTRYFKRGDELPYRIVEARRADMARYDGHVLPTRLFVSDAQRRSSTEVVITNLRVNPPIDERVFSLTALEQERKLPEAASLPPSARGREGPALP